MIRLFLLALASFGFLWVATPANAAAAAIQPLVHFDAPGHQSANVTPVVYHRHRHRHYHHH